MQEKYFLKRWELSCIVLNLSTYKIFTGYARIFSDISGPAAVLNVLFSGLAMWVVIWGLLLIYEKSGKKTLVEIAEKSIGKAGKYLVYGVVLIYLLFSSSLTLRQTGELISAVSFPSAPLVFIFIIVMLGAVVCCAQGFNGIGRCHSIVIPISLTLTTAVLIMGFSKGEVSYLSPWLGYGIKNTFIRGLSSIGLYSDLIILFMLYPFAQREINYKKTVLSSFGAGILINALIILGFTMIAPYTVANTINHPYLQLVKLFSAGRFFQRIDGYFMYIVSGCGILSLAVNMFFISYGAKEAFNFPKTRPLAYPLGLLIIFLALLPKRREEVTSISRNSLWIWVVAIFLTAFVVLTISAVKRRRES